MSVDTVATFSWAEVVDIGHEVAYSIHRAGQADWSAARPILHTHADFGEMFWVESGSALHEIDSGCTTVRAGEVVFIAESDRHRFRNPSPDFGIVNLAVPSETIVDLERRYSARRSPWRQPRPRTFRPVAHDWARLLELGSALGHGRSIRMRLDHFLIEVMMMLDAPVPTERPLPGWLSDAITAWRDDSDAMSEGVRGLARISGRSREHVSREVKVATGMRAIDVVNRLRIEHAASLLRMSDRSIAQIAAEAGLGNLSHFYNVFRSHYGTTPRKYRMTQRRTLLTPLT